MKPVIGNDAIIFHSVANVQTMKEANDTGVHSLYKNDPEQKHRHALLSIPRNMN